MVYIFSGQQRTCADRAHRLGLLHQFTSPNHMTSFSVRIPTMWTHADTLKSISENIPVVSCSSFDFPTENRSCGTIRATGRSQHPRDPMRADNLDRCVLASIDVK